MNDLGCIIQQLYLIIHGLGLSGCAVGNDDPTTIETALGIDSAEEALVGGFLIW